MLSFSTKRRGEGGFGGLLMLVIIGAGLWFFFLRSDGDGGVRGRGVFSEPPRPEVVNSQHNYNPFGDSNRIVTVRNVGGDGRVTVEVRAYRDKEAKQFIDSWSTVLYLKRGEEKSATIVLTGLTEGGGCLIQTSASAE